MKWGAALTFGDGGSDEGTWQPESSTRYKFYVSTVYDGTQESLPQLLCMYPSSDLASNTDFVGATADSEIAFTDSTNYGTPGQNCSAYFKPVVKIKGADHSLTSSHAPHTDDYFAFGGDAVNTVANANPRVTGIRFYWATNEEGYGNLWRLFDCDFAKGTKSYGIAGGSGESSYAPWTHHRKTSSGSYYYMAADFPTNNVWHNPPRILSYFTANGHSHVEDISVEGYRTAVIANQRAYIGNVKRKIDGVTVNFPDRMMKSPVGAYDKFPANMFIDVVTEDGDEIIHLAAYADRILQFKKKKMYIINISGDSEFLESENNFHGVSHEGAVATTDIGIIWANEHGAFLYNGSKIINLLQKGGRDVISQDYWRNTFLGHDTSTDYKMLVGYHPAARQIIFCADAGKVNSDNSNGHGDNDVLIFSLKTQSWIEDENALVVNTSYSNFINDYNGDLIYYSYDGDKMEKRTTTERVLTSGNLLIKTKDWDFGQPAVRKKIYKVYLSYKGDGRAVEINYAINGDNDTSTGQFFRCGGDGVSTNATASNTPLSQASVGEDDWICAELIPTASINNIYSFQLVLGGATTDANFEINDISIVYRLKGIK